MEKYMEFAKKSRAAFKGYDDVRDARLTEPETVTAVKNIKYGSHPQQVMDVYYPKNTDIPRKTIVSIHGGAYVYGDKERYRFYCMDLAARGFTVVNFSYRLAPEAPYPAQIEDVNSVFRFIADHFSEHFIDLEKLFAVGDSAGAQLACQYAAMLTNRDYGELYAMELPDIRIRGLGLNCGMYDLKSLVEQGSHSEMFDAYFQGREGDFAAHLDILGSITSAFPTSFVMTAVYDHLRHDSEPLTAVFDRLGIPYKFRIYGNEGDAHMTHVFHLNLALDEARQCNGDECAFFDSLV